MVFAGDRNSTSLQHLGIGVISFGLVCNRTRTPPAGTELKGSERKAGEGQAAPGQAAHSELRKRVGRCVSGSGSCLCPHQTWRPRRRSPASRNQWNRGGRLIHAGGLCSTLSDATPESRKPLVHVGVLRRWRYCSLCPWR
ncbi:hypothetical protein H8959_002028 [Pygathrix nigripes]